MSIFLTLSFVIFIYLLCFLRRLERIQVIDDTQSFIIIIIYTYPFLLLSLICSLYYEVFLLLLIIPTHACYFHVLALFTSVSVLPIVSFIQHDHT